MIWRIEEWPTPWTQLLIITLPEKGNLQLCQNNKTISLGSQASKVMLKVILNRLNPQAEEITAEKQAGFRAGRSTDAQPQNLEMKSTSNINKSCTMSSLISRTPLTGYGICGNTISMQIWYIPKSSSTTRLQVQLRRTAAQENGSEQQLELCLFSLTLLNILSQRNYD